LGSRSIDVASLNPGDEYFGPSDRRQGSFKVTQRAGGGIERTTSGAREIALLDGDSPQAANARATLTAWRHLNDPPTRFFVNELDHAWYEAGGARRFLAAVPGGYSWPDEIGDKQ
jgi:hypothetical protein